MPTPTPEVSQINIKLASISPIARTAPTRHDPGRLVSPAGQQSTLVQTWPNPAGGEQQLHPPEYRCLLRHPDVDGQADLQAGIGPADGTPIQLKECYDETGTLLYHRPPSSYSNYYNIVGSPGAWQVAADPNPGNQQGNFIFYNLPVASGRGPAGTRIVLGVGNARRGLQHLHSAVGRRRDLRLHQTRRPMAGRSRPSCRAAPGNRAGRDRRCPLTSRRHRHLRSQVLAPRRSRRRPPNPNPLQTLKRTAGRRGRRRHLHRPRPARLATSRTASWRSATTPPATMRRPASISPGPAQPHRFHRRGSPACRWWRSPDIDGRWLTKVGAQFGDGTYSAFMQQYKPCDLDLDEGGRRGDGACQPSPSRSTSCRCRRRPTAMRCSSRRAPPAPRATGSSSRPLLDPAQRHAGRSTPPTAAGAC